MDRRSVPGEVVTTTIRDVRGHLRDISPSTPIPFDLTATTLTDGYHNLRVQGHIGPIPAPLAMGRAPIEADLQAEDLLLGALPPSVGGSLPRVGGRIGADLKVQGSMGGDLNVAGALSLGGRAWRNPTGGEAAATLPLLVSTQKITLNLANASIQIAEAQLDLSSLRATLTGAVADVHTSPQFDLQLTTTAFSPGDLLPQIPLLASIIPAPTEVQGRAQLQAAVTGTPHALRADVQLEVNNGALKSRGIRVETDTIHMSLTAHLAKPRAPHVRLDLSAHRLVVAQREGDTRLPAVIPPPGPTPHAPRAHTRLPPVTLSGTVKIAQGRIQQLRFQQLTADVALAQGRLTTTHRATLYGGSYRGMARINLAGGEPAYTMDAHVAGVQLGAAMRMWTSAKTVRQGVLTTRVKLSGQGWTWARLRQTLSGDGHATITDFKVMPADPPHVRTRKVTFVSPLGNMTRRIRMKHESIHTVKAILHMRQGHLLSDDLQLWGKDVAIRARGHLGLDQSVTCNGTLALSGERASAQGILAKLFLRDAHNRIIYPFTVTGRVSDPQACGQRERPPRTSDRQTDGRTEMRIMEPVREGLRQCYQ
jgi:AsmA-like C-terminal region